MSLSLTLPEGYTENNMGGFVLLSLIELGLILLLFCQETIRSLDFFKCVYWINVYTLVSRTSGLLACHLL